METVSLHELRTLAEVKATGAVSIYLPTVGSGPEEAQDLVRWNELVEQAAKGGASEAAVASLRGVPQNPAVWKHRRAGLAALAWNDQLRTVSSPTPFVGSANVGSRLHVKPLLAQVDRGHWFFLLIASRNHTHLFKVNRAGIESIDVPGFPERMDEALNYAGADRGSQVHSGTRGGTGKGAAVFHGQGGERDASKSDLSQYFHLVDRALHPVLNGRHAPLVLACVEYLVPIFRAACTYSHLVPEHLEGNFDRESTRELHDRSWALMASRFDEPRRAALSRVAEVAGTDKGASEVTQIVRGAADGRVQTLLVDPDASLAGTFDEATEHVTVGAGGASVDLVNLAISETLRHGGEVHVASAAQLPDRSPLAAVFRY